MKVLLDENIPRKLKYRFSEEFEILTVPDMGWSGIKNGDLLKRMNEKEFNVLISLDKNMSHQQNLEKFKVCLIVLDSKNSLYSTVLGFIPKIENLLTKELIYGLHILE
jgi:hypothetical protein